MRFSLAAVAAIASLSLACGSGGGSGGATRRYVYVANGASNTVAQFSVADDGHLVPLSPATVAAGAFPSAVMVDPHGRFLWVKNSNDGTVSQYTIGADGRLAANGASLDGQGGGGYGIADAAGANLYLSTYDGVIRHLVVGADGRLSPAAAPTVSVLGKTTGLALAPDGAHLYVAAFGADVIDQLAVASDGALSPLVPDSVPTAGNPRAIALSPDGAHAYVSCLGDGAVGVYDVAGDGKLSARGTVAADRPSGLALAPDGAHLYVALDVGIEQFTVAANGDLTSLGTVALPDGASELAVTPDGAFLYATTYGEEVRQYAIAADGTLGAIAGAAAAVSSGSGASNGGIAVVTR